MSIQRLHPVTDYNSVWVEPDPDGEYVTYADHVAEVERVSVNADDWRDAVEQSAEAMRAACIAAVDHDIDCRYQCDPDTDERDCTCYYPRIIALLREVKP
jgi:hypothetical protein